LSTTYKILSSILLSRLTPYSEEFTGDHQCGFQRKISTTDHVFCVPQVPDKRLEYSAAVYELLAVFKKACNSFTRELLRNILSEFAILMKMLRLIKICLKYFLLRMG
jgi:hypothetical protein